MGRFICRKGFSSGNPLLPSMLSESAHAVGARVRRLQPASLDQRPRFAFAFPRASVTIRVLREICSIGDGMR
jgi:hypothetical protein